MFVIILKVYFACILIIEAAAEKLSVPDYSHQQIIQENEHFALGWIRATFEASPGIKIEQDELYKKYYSCCTKNGRRGVIAPAHFPRCVRYETKIYNSSI